MSDITSQIIDYCLDLIYKQAAAGLEAAPDHLSKLADETNFPNERTMYLDSMHELNFARKSVYDKFCQEIRTPFQVLKTNEVAEVFRSKGGVVSNITGAKELEEKLALETILSKSKATTEISLQNISRSFDSLMGNDWVKRHYNPMAPEFIIRAWVKAIHVMQMDANGNLAMYTVLDNEILKFLPVMYENIGRFIESLSKKRHQKRTSESDNDAQQQDLDDVSETSDLEEMFGDIDSADPHDAILEDNDFDDDQPPDEINTKNLIKVLNTLQRDRSLDESDFYSSNYLLDLRSLLEDKNATEEGVINAWTVGLINDDVIDMTRLMFSFIVDDYNLPDDIRFHVSRLQIPYLKLGLDDKTLFLTKEHPARQLLMDITQSINLWNPAHSGGLDRLLNKIIDTINEILTSYEYDKSIFDRLNESFKAFLDGDEQNDNFMREHKSDQQNRAQKADNAKLHIEGTLSDICNGHRIPPIVENILENYWSNLLFLEYLKDGENTETYQEFLKTAEMLVTSVQPKFTEDERKAMAKQLPIIIKRLKIGLNEIAVVSFESVDLFRELQQCHMEVLKEHPENQPAQEFEVDEEEYDEFRAEQNIDFVWDREAIEASMLEDNIERSISMADTDPHAFDDNPNIIRGGSRSDVNEAAVDMADRERQIIDDELREARDAYEQALQDHKDKKSQDSGNTPEEDDFMAMFFQDPEFEKKQLSSNRKADKSEQSDQADSDDDYSAEDEMDAYTNEIDIGELGDLDDSSDEDSDEFNKGISGKTDELESNEHQASTVDTTKSETKSEFEPEQATDQSAYSEENTKTSHEEVDTQIDSKETPGSNIDAQSGQVGEDREGLQKRSHGALEEEEGSMQLEDAVVEELIERLKVGIWVDLYHADGQKVRAKIMAIVPTVGKYIFGDRSGRKIADYNRKSLFEAIQQGKLRLDELDTAYDRTLESVIANLRVMKKAEDD